MAPALRAIPHQSDPIGGLTSTSSAPAADARKSCRLIEVEIVVGVFDRNAETAAIQFRNEPDDERGLARSAPSGEADYAHDQSSYSSPHTLCSRLPPYREGKAELSQEFALTGRAATRGHSPGPTARDWSS